MNRWQPGADDEALRQRAALLADIRSFFAARHVLEVDTPLLCTSGITDPSLEPLLVEQGSSVTATRYLQTSPEYAMKRLLAAGSGPIYQIAHAFRDDESGRRHNPEFTLLEWYRVGIDYNALMNECMELLFVLLPEGKLCRGGRTIDLTMPWQKLTVTEAFTQYASMDLNQALASDCFEEILTSEVEPHLGKEKPTFLTEYPSSLAALARSKPGEPQFAERFELYIDGLELANAFSELTDPEEQRCRFEKDEELRRTAGKTPYPLPEKFLAELENMPEAAGIALGLDRLIMLITEAEKIDDVVAFGPDDL